MPSGIHNNQDTKSWIKKSPCSVCSALIPANQRGRHICPGRTLNDFENACFEYWKTKKQRTNANLRRKGFGPRFLLSVDDIILLFETANITPAQIGRKRGTYNLCRFGDTGDYEMGNCRFATWEENRLEELALREDRKKSDPTYRQFIHDRNKVGAQKRNKRRMKIQTISP